jgi:GTP diphosphokinase / guanosine-3',5'-bis(diphosphate) 3'-diphosphatase
MTLAYEAMLFAREVHREQQRRYTGCPYFCHLSEVAGIVASCGDLPMHCDSAGDMYKVGDHAAPMPRDIPITVALLHDCAEDWGITESELTKRFGALVAKAVYLLSDLEIGNRAARKAASRARLAASPGWIQTIKVADLISNTPSIVMHDPKFAVTYLEEKRLLLDVMTKADPRLVAIARGQVGV